MILDLQYLRIHIGFLIRWCSVVFFIKALRVLYDRKTSDDVCVLSASGTAAIIDLKADLDSENANINKLGPRGSLEDDFSELCSTNTCSLCHIPYNENGIPFRVNILKCPTCKNGKVTDVILSTTELPDVIQVNGRGCFLQACVYRPKKDLRGELHAKEISDSLPFLEYELHRLLSNKLKVKGMNSIFKLNIQISIGEKVLVGIATGTAVYLPHLSPPRLPKLVVGHPDDEKKLEQMQKILADAVKSNRDHYQLKYCDIEANQYTTRTSDAEDSDELDSEIDLTVGNKDSYFLEVDDSEDIKVINLLIEPKAPDGFYVANTEVIPGLQDHETIRNLQMFTQVWRSKIQLNRPIANIGQHFQHLLQSVFFKLRRMIPCALCNVQFKIDLPEADEIQLRVLGMALGLREITKPAKTTPPKPKSLQVPANKDEELIFSLEDDLFDANSISPSTIVQSRSKSPLRNRFPKIKHTPITERHGVDITPLTYIPRGKIERYLGNLNFFFIRETTSIREGGGWSGLVHSFMTEVLAILRAHVMALGGNALVAYFMTECILYYNPHKNQGQCLINVGGDVVYVTYYVEE